MLNKEIIDKFLYSFDKFQIEACSTIENNCHTLVTAFTGSGKSSVAEYAIYKAFIENKKIIYTSPIKTLSNQKYAEFKVKFSEYGTDNIGIQTGDVKLNPDAQCLIMTTEILHNMLFNNTISDEVTYVIFDEIHYINDKNRGHIWEECIMKLPKHIIMVMLSATMANQNEFSKWIESIQEKKVVISSNIKRPVPLCFYVCVPNPLLFDENMNWIEAIKENHICKLLDENESNFQELSFINMKNKYNAYISYKFEENPTKKITKKMPFDMLSMLNKFLNFLHINKLVPVTLFTLSRKKCNNLADKVNLSMVNNDELSEIERIFNLYIRKINNYESYEQIIKMKKWLFKGIAVHHSGLFPILKEIVEILYTKGLIKVLFATETFAVGINCPTKTVVFLDLTKFVDQGKRILTTEEFKQMAGRAGRRGLDKIGYVIYFPIVDMISPLQIKKMCQGKLANITSKFKITPNYILIIINNEKNIINFTQKTLCFSENIILKKSYYNELSTLSHKKTKMINDLENIDINIKSIYNKVQDINIELKTSSQKTKKKLQRSIIDIINSLSKNEKYIYDNLDNLTKDISSLNDFIDKLNYNIINCDSSLSDDIKICIDFLIKHNYIIKFDSINNLSKENVTLKSIFSSKISQCNQILLTECLFSGLFDNYKNKNKNSIIDFVCILSVFLNEDESDFTDYSISDTIGNKLNNDINNLISFSNNIIQDECLSKKYVCIIYEWCNNESLNNICKNYGLFEGNVIRMINKLLNLLQEIKTGYESILEFEWTLIIDDVHNFIYKDILDTPSIYVS